MTGVLVLLIGGSLLLHPASNSKLQKKSFTQRRKAAKFSLWFSFAPLRLCVKTASDLFVMAPPDRGTFIWFLGQRLTGDSILAFDPLAQVDELAPLRTEGTKRIVFPVDWFTAGWAFHESLATKTTAPHQRDAGRLINIRRLTNAIVPSRRMAFKRTVTLSRVEPTMEAISR